MPCRGFNEESLRREGEPMHGEGQLSLCFLEYWKTDDLWPIALAREYFHRAFVNQVKKKITDINDVLREIALILLFFLFGEDFNSWLLR